MATEAAEFLEGPNGRIAYRRRYGTGPGLVWLGGFRSDMLGTKAGSLDEWAAARGRGFMRFDYSGHGESDGAFEDGSIGLWTADALAAFDALAQGPQILIGSSMGAWIASLLALARPGQIAGIVFIAPAPDFTERLMWPAFSEAERQTLAREGRLEMPSEYSEEPEIVTLRLIEDGRRQLVMTAPIAINAPIRILQGMRDEAVPWRHALEFAALLESEDVEITLTKSGDHRLSGPEDLRRLGQILETLIGRLNP